MELVQNVENMSVSEVADGNLEEALRVLLDSRAEVERLDAELEGAKKTEEIASQAIIEKMAEQGLQSFKALGKTVSCVEDIRAWVLAENQAQQFEWLRQIGFGGFIKTKETVNAASFGAMVRNDFIKAGKESELPEFVKVARGQKLLLRAVSR